jgi:hypothetical protein
MDKQQLLDELYYLLYWTENEAAYEIVGNAIDFIKGQ